VSRPPAFSFAQAQRPLRSRYFRTARSVSNLINMTNRNGSVRFGHQQLCRSKVATGSGTRHGGLVREAESNSITRGPRQIVR
jgi:hypothetical protein